MTNEENPMICGFPKEASTHLLTRLINIFKIIDWVWLHIEFRIIKHISNIQTGQEKRRKEIGEVPEDGWEAVEYHFWVYDNAWLHKLVHCFFLKETCT